MNRVVVQSRVDTDGVLRINVPVGADEANREVRVTIEQAPANRLTQEEYEELIRSTAGAWQGEFERPDQGEFEVREPFA